MSLISKVQQIGVKKDAGSVQSSFALNPSQYRENSAGMWMFGQNGVDHFFTYNGHNSSLKAYTDCPPVAAIINRKAQAYINGKTWVLNSRGKEATSYDAGNLRKLLKRPNPLQNWKQFEAQAYVYQQLFGFTLILPIKPIGFTRNVDATMLWNIPPFMLEFKESDRLFYQTNLAGIIDKITLTYKNVTSTLNVKDVFILKDFVPSFTSMIFPESRVCALEKPINNIIGAYESRNTLINFRGAQGFLSPDKDPMGVVTMSDPEKQALQNDFRRYGLRNGQWQVIISNSLLRWQQMGYPTKDLLLMEEVEESTRALCAGFNFPPFILGLADTTFNNMNVAEKGLYQNSIMPDAESNYEQWNEFFALDELNLRLDKDYNHITVLQEDQKTAADARNARNNALKIEWRNGMITLNEWRTKNGEDPLSDDRGKMYFPEYVAMYGDPDKPAAAVPPIDNNQNQNNGNETQGQAQGGQGGA